MEFVAVEFVLCRGFYRAGRRRTAGIWPPSSKKAQPVLPDLGIILISTPIAITQRPTCCPRELLLNQNGPQTQKTRQKWPPVNKKLLPTCSQCQPSSRKYSITFSIYINLHPAATQYDN